MNHWWLDNITTKEEDMSISVNKVKVGDKVTVVHDNGNTATFTVTGRINDSLYSSDHAYHFIHSHWKITNIEKAIPVEPPLDSIIVNGNGAPWIRTKRGWRCTNEGWYNASYDSRSWEEVYRDTTKVLYDGYTGAILKEV